MENDKDILGDWKKVGEIIILIATLLGPAIALWLGSIQIPAFDNETFQKAVLTFLWITIIGFLFVFIRLDRLGKKQKCLET